MKVLRVLVMILSFIFMSVLPSIAITVDGDYTDWFPNVMGFQDVDSIANDVTGEIDHGFTNGIYWAEEDYVEPGTYGQVYPGYGGQSFDHEGLYLTSDNENYYIGLMTGMAPGANYSSWSTTPQYIGDIALDITGDGVFNLGIDMEYIRTGMTPVEVSVNIVESWTNTTYYNPIYNPTPYKMNASTASTISVDIQHSKHEDSWFYEFGIDKSLTGFDPSDGVELFVTMSCGNDWLQVYNTPTLVPEPTTLILLGSGFIGLIGTAKRNIRRKV